MASGGYFFYMHRDLSGTPDVWKIGKSLTPYSAIRARQRYTWKQVQLDHLWFGVPSYVSKLENNVKKNFKSRSGAALTKLGTQTELFLVPEEELLRYIKQTIRENGYRIKKMSLDAPYTATSWSNCPLKCADEKIVHTQLDAWVRQEWPGARTVKHQFDLLFEMT